MTKKLNWRLSKLPTTEELRELVKDKIITQEEARDILFNEVDSTKRDTGSLEAEIKFLRELVQKLSTRSTIIEQIRYIERPYIQYPWYQPYVVYCSSGGNILTANGNTQYYAGNTVNTSTSVSNLVDQTWASASNQIENFTDIQTF